MSSTRNAKLHTSGCFSMPAAWFPMLALSTFAVTTSSKSMALSIPVAAKLSTSLGASLSLLGLSTGDLGAPESSPSAAMAPGPAGLDRDFFAFAFGAAFFTCTDASSSARSRAFSNLRARSAWRFSSFSSLLLADLEPSAHLSASVRSFRNRI